MGTVCEGRVQSTPENNGSRSRFNTMKMQASAFVSLACIFGGFDGSVGFLNIRTFNSASACIFQSFLKFEAPSQQGFPLPPRGPKMWSHKPQEAFNWMHNSSGTRESGWGPNLTPAQLRSDYCMKHHPSFSKSEGSHCPCQTSFVGGDSKGGLPAPHTGSGSFVCIRCFFGGSIQK